MSIINVDAVRKGPAKAERQMSSTVSGIVLGVVGGAMIWGALFGAAMLIWGR